MSTQDWTTATTAVEDSTGVCKQRKLSITTKFRLHHPNPNVWDRNMDNDCSRMGETSGFL